VAWFLASYPPLDLGLPFAPAQVTTAYLQWPLLPDLFPVSFPGVKTSRDDVVVGIDRERLVRRMKKYFDPQVSHEELRRICPAAMSRAARFEPEAVRDHLRKRGFFERNIVRYCYRPFDVRWLYWEPETKLLGEKRAAYLPHVFEGNIWLAAVRQDRKSFDPPIVADTMCSLHVIERGANMFPLFLANAQEQGVLGRDGERKPTRSNVTSEAASYTEQLKATAPDLFYHTLAILHAPAYRQEDAGALRQGWPRGQSRPHHCSGDL
jgi:predicted helicase